jgi:hypothetical protein
VEFRDRLQQAMGSDVVVEQFHQFFEIESCRRAQLRSVPWDEWVMWLDADETPSPTLLANMRATVYHAEANGIDLIKYYWSEHTNGVHKPPGIIPKTMEEYQNRTTVFAANRFIKKKHGIKLASSFGAHEQFTNINQKWLYVAHAVHHHKSYLQYAQSVSFSGFMNPASHYDASKPISNVLNTPEYKALKAFQKRTGVYTSNDMVRKLKIDKDEQFRKELKELFLSFPSDADGKSVDFKHADVCATFKFMHELAEKYDLDVNSPYYPCGKECCNYGNIQL